MRVEQAETSPLAIISLVFGVLGWFALPLFGALVAIIAGHVARGQIRESRGELQGDGLAVAGLILGYLSLGLVVLIAGLMMIFGLGLFAFLSAGSW
ncbi:MAG: DUF4190 domain-containing protein [Wenzhouxiangella sp.]